MCQDWEFCEQNRYGLCPDGVHRLEGEKGIKQEESKHDVSCDDYNERGVGRKEDLL